MGKKKNPDFTLSMVGSQGWFINRRVMSSDLKRALWLQGGEVTIETLQSRAEGCSGSAGERTNRQTRVEIMVMGRISPVRLQL